MASGRSKTAQAAKIALAGAAVGAGIGLLALPGAPGRAQTPNISAVVVKATHACFASAIRFTGLVVPRAEAVVNLNIAGYEISEILVKEGDTVTSGQALAKLTRLGGAGANGPPGGQGAGAAALQQPATMTLNAPAAGLVSLSTAKIGTVAAALPLPPPMGPKPLFEIIVDNKIEIEADVPSIQLPKLSSGQLARVHLENGRDFSGKIRTIFPEIDRKTQLGKVRISIDSDPAIRAGMFASGTIDASHSCGVSIPRAAVQYQTEGTTVQVVRNTMVETRHVRLGFYSDNTIEVLSGVKEGELVIANAGTSLHDGDHVTPQITDQPEAR